MVTVRAPLAGVGPGRLDIGGAAPARARSRGRLERLRREVAVALILCAAAGTSSAQALVFFGDRDLPPYEYIENGKAKGANVDLAVAIGRILGRPVEVDLLDWSEAQTRLRSGKGDALTMLASTKERERYFDFSRPTLPTAFALFVRSDEAVRFDGRNLRGKRIGVTKAGFSRDWLEANQPDAELVVVANLREGTRRLQRGEIDAFAAQVWSEFYLLNGLGIRGITALPPFLVMHGTIAVRKGDKALLAQIDRAIEQLKSTGEFDRIIDRWSHTKVYLFSDSTVRAAEIAAMAAGMALLVLAFASLWLRRQKKALSAEVQKRRDIESRLLESEAELKVANRLKEQFFATLAHELKSPLAPILNVAPVLKSKDDPQVKRAGDVIDRQGWRLSRLIDDLLDVNRIASHKLELHKQPVPINDVIEDAIQASGPIIERLGHRLTVEPTPEPLVLNADRVRLAQVLTNLLTNAAKYTPSPGRITLAARRQEHTVVVSVKDNGVGIAPENLGRLFQMFYQEERSASRSDGGMGIGLWISRSLAGMHGGSLEAHSTGEGKGSEFILRLPLPETRPSAAAPATA